MARSAGTLAALAILIDDTIVDLEVQLRGFLGEGPDEWQPGLLAVHAAALEALADARARLEQLRDALEPPATPQEEPDHE